MVAVVCFKKWLQRVITQIETLKRKIPCSVEASEHVQECCCIYRASQACCACMLSNFLWHPQQCSWPLIEASFNAQILLDWKGMAGMDTDCHQGNAILSVRLGIRYLRPTQGPCRIQFLSLKTGKMLAHLVGKISLGACLPACTDLETDAYCQSPTTLRTASKWYVVSVHDSWLLGPVVSLSLY